MTWFRFSQNNSYGRFDVSEDLAPEVYIEATDAEEANKRAVSIGLYFDGEGDCPCCGNRWSEAGDYTDKGEVPTAYKKPVTSPEYWQGTYLRNDLRCHFLDRRVLAIRNLAEAVAAFGGAP